MSGCKQYDPEIVFKRFKLLEFPTSFVGLSTTLELEVDEDITKSAFLKTMYLGSLLNFDEAREVSAAHRAFTLKLLNKKTLQITFKPITECISRIKMFKKFVDNRFVFDLRLIKVDGVRCCNNEHHSEVGRYYISGQYEYCIISHSPKTVDFGEVLMKTKVSKTIRIRNESKLIEAKITYIKTPAYDVTPMSFVVPPNSTKRILVTVFPNGLIIGKAITLHVRNPHDMFEEPAFGVVPTDKNFFPYSIPITANIIFNGNIKTAVVESLHNLYEPQPRNTYLNEELTIHNERVALAKQFLQFSKSTRAKPKKEKYISLRDKCDDIPETLNIKPKWFCKDFRVTAKAQDLFDILFTPILIDFGSVGIQTYSQQQLLIRNRSKYDVTIKFLPDKYILYSQDKLRQLIVKLSSKSEARVTLFVLGHASGMHKGTFGYVVDKNHCREHPYTLQCGNPTLYIRENAIKFGMVTNEGFVTSVPVKIFNFFNVPVDFEWEEISNEAPFEIIPTTGAVPAHSCSIVDIIYTPKIIKSKTFEIIFVSKGKVPHKYNIEVTIMSRKLSIKFLQSALIFKDIPLNLESIQIIKLENASREMAHFSVNEPLLPGMIVTPMSGIIRPKSVIMFHISVKIACILDFSYDLYLKINNKENLGLPISGNVVEPKINITPKSICVPRVPCGMVTFIPVTFQNTGVSRTEIEVLDTGDENMFNVYASYGSEKVIIEKFTIEEGHSKIVYVKVCDIFRREYDMYIPFQINGLIGPPNQDTRSLELQYYIGPYERLYESSIRARVKSMNKDISHFRLSGVITVPWIRLSVEKFEIIFEPNGQNCIDFSMTNISKYYLHVCIVTSKLAPHFGLDLTTENHESIINEYHIKFELDRGQEAHFSLHFHPRGLGKFVAVALLYLDASMSVPYSNFTFIGKRETARMTPSSYQIIFPPSYVGTEITKSLTITYEEKTSFEMFTCSSKEEPSVCIKFLGCEYVENEDQTFTILHVEVSVCCVTAFARNLTLIFHHETGSLCDVLISFSYTYCPLTLHAHSLVSPDENPYPFYPLCSQTNLYEYLETCTGFLERWMFQQGFRRDLFPQIPDTFHATSSMIESSYTKSKGINVSFLNFIRRIAGPLMKHIHKESFHDPDDPIRSIREIHETYRSIIHLIRSRGASQFTLQAKFLLTHRQFIKYNEHVPPKFNADYYFTEELINDKHLYDRLTKQSWIDIILQCYKVFAMDSCFFDCVCVSNQPRNIVQVLVDWYNEQTLIGHRKLFKKDKPVKRVTNLTTDLKDGIAIISAMMNHCPFLCDHLSVVVEVDQDNPEGGIIHNACLIIEAINQMRQYFPLCSTDFLEPNFLQMLFLSIHLYVTLPMYKSKCTVEFNPPLLRVSNRLITVNPGQESLLFNLIILNNNKNVFSVEKVSSENGKKIYMNVKYTANFVSTQTAILLVHGYNKTRIFDTYILFDLIGNIGALNPVKKCKVTAPIYRPNKVDILVHTPFNVSAVFELLVVDDEPMIPVKFTEPDKVGFYVKRLNLIDNEIVLNSTPSDVPDTKVHLQMYCLNTQVENSWIWFRSDVGEFFIRVTTQPRWDLALDTIQVNVHNWPMDPCSCGESCECYRTSIVMVPHRNELMVKALRFALLEHASECMMEVFDQLVETPTGQIILTMLLTESGTHYSDIQHILRPENTYKVTSRNLMPQLDRVTFKQHTDALLALPVTVPPNELMEKFSITFTSDCGMDIRTYRILFVKIFPPKE